MPSANARQMNFGLYLCINKCNIYPMARPTRTRNPDLARDLRTHMAERGYSTADIGAATGVDKATISRSLKKGAFSDKLATRLSSLLTKAPAQQTPERLLQESLRLLRVSDKLRADAERMIAQALDQTTASK